MPRRHPWLRRLTFAIGGLLALLGAATVVERLGGSRLGGPVVAVVEVRGVIASSDVVCDALSDVRQDPHVVAVVLRVDSPGGGVAPSQEIFDEIRRVRDVKPIIASLGNVAASGGYYIAAATTRIVSDPGTLTGSIGVIMEFRNLETLAQKIGIGETVVKSGPYKDIGNPVRPMTPAERTLLQGTVDDVYAQFVDAVSTGRGLAPERVRAIADGRVLSGAQALQAGLVDELGGLNAAIRVAWA